MMGKRPSFPVLMKSLALFATLSTLFLALAYHLRPFGWLLTAAISFGTTAYHFLMRLAVGFLVPKCTGYSFDWRKPWFRPRPWEAGLYKKLRLKRWKGRIPTYDPTQFSLEHHAMEQVVRNMCGAELVHEIIMVLSFLPLAFSPVFGAFSVFLITSVLAALYDGIFVMAQRFNRPRLVRILEKASQRETT